MRKGYTTNEVIVPIVLSLVLLGFVALVASGGGFTQSDEATRILRQSGYTDIEITGWRPFMAGKDDTFSTGFRAKSPSGEVVTGAVTSGWFKGSTVRLD